MSTIVTVKADYWIGLDRIGRVLDQTIGIALAPFGTRFSYYYYRCSIAFFGFGSG